MLVIAGEADKIVPPERARRIAELTDAELLVIEGGGHAPHVRYPVAVNHAIRDFVDRAVRRQRKRAVWQAAPTGSSTIGPACGWTTRRLRRTT